MPQRTLFRIGVVLATMASLVTVTAVTAAADDETPTNCVVSVIGQTDDGEYILSDEECFTGFDDAMASIGLGKNVDTPQEAVDAAAAASSILAVHFDGANYTGDSFSVSGVDCGGGYLNLPAVWDNRVSSTFGGICPRIRHWTGANKTGSFQDTLNTGNLSSPVNNAVTSIQYLT